MHVLLKSPTKVLFLSYDDCILLVGRRYGAGEDWPPTVIRRSKKMKSLALHTHDSFSAGLRDCMLFVAFLVTINLRLSETAYIGYRRSCCACFDARHVLLRASKDLAKWLHSAFCAPN